MSARWYKRCGADFIHGTMSLTLEEKGAYSLCLDLIYDRGGPIPDDARWLSGVCGVSIRKWNSLRERLIEAGKIYVTGNMLSNVRADFELVSTELQRRNQAETGAKGGRKSAENRAALNKNSDLGQATLKPIEEIREDKNITPNGVDVRQKPFPRLPVAEPEVWDDFLKNRKAKRLPNTATAHERLKRDLAAMAKQTGWTEAKIFRVCVERGWGAIYNPVDGLKANSDPPPGHRDFMQRQYATALPSPEVHAIE